MERLGTADGVKDLNLTAPSSNPVEFFGPFFRGTKEGLFQGFSPVPLGMGKPGKGVGSATLR